MSTLLQTQTKAESIPSFVSARTGLLQRKCACGQHTIAGGECEECHQKREGMVQRAAVTSAPVNSVPPIVYDVLSSPGQSLDPGTQAFMKPRFGYDFSQVRVHTDARAAESARAVNALAYTVGRDVVFGTGMYGPGTSEGRRLLAHELTHVVQQGGITPGTLNGVSSPISASEQEATSIAEHVEQNMPYQSQVVTGMLSDSRGTLQRQADAGDDSDEVMDASTVSGGVADSPDVGVVPDVSQTSEESDDFKLPPPTFSRPSKRGFSLLRPGKQLQLRPQNFCGTRILAESTCQFLALHSKYICCDPNHGFKRPGRKTSELEPGKTCSSEKWTPHFTCDTKGKNKSECETALEKGCDDDDHWMALPPKKFKLSKCGDLYTICANAKKTWGYVRDSSSSQKSYEVSPGIQKAIGVKVGDTFQGAIYPPGTDQSLIDLNPCCNWPPLTLPTELKLKSGEEAKP